MPGGISTPQERGYFAPGDQIEDAVSAFVRNKVRTAQQAVLEAKAAQSQSEAAKSQTEAQLSAAEAAPKVDVESIIQSVLAERAKAHVDAQNQEFLADPNMNPNERAARLAGHLPAMSEQSVSYDPSGAAVTTNRQGFQGPGNVLQPFGGSVTRGAPPVSTSTTVKPNDPNAPNTPGLAVVSTAHTVIDPATGEKRTLDTTEAPQRVTPPHGDAALIDMADRLGVDPDDLSEEVQAMLTKKASPAAARSGTVESLNSQLVQLNGELKVATDPEEKDFLTKQMANIQGRVDALNNQYKPKPGKPTTAEAVAAALGLSGDAPAAAPPARPVSPVGSKPPEKGKTYTDAKGNRATWDGTKYVELAPSR